MEVIVRIIVGNIAFPAERINMDNSSIVDITPDVNLVNSLANSNHNFLTALADLMDNSIDAECSEIHIKGGIKNGKTYLIIADDGNGMDIETVSRAMKYGWHNPENKNGLGRFGMGMKTSSTCIGRKFTILTKTEKSELLKAIYDPELMNSTGRWIAHVSLTVEPDDIASFNEYVGENEKSGTVIRIEELKQFTTSANLSQKISGIKKTLGRIFRYFLTPITQKESNTGIIKIFINGNEIFGIDPLEQHAPNTVVKFDEKIEIATGRFVHAKCVYISELDAGQNNEDNHGVLHYHCQAQTYQGVYVVRGNREIMAAETKIFEPIWDTRRQDKSWCRIELRYSNMDDVFRVSVDKCGINDVEQSAMDKLSEKLAIYVRQIQNVRRSFTASKTTEELEKIHSAVETEISNKNKLLEFPRSKKVEKIKKGNKNGTILPRNTNETRSGKANVFTSKAGNFKVGFRDFGAAGQLFNLEWEKSVIIIEWNTSHPFYQKYMGDPDVDKISAIDYMAFALASHLTREIQEKGDDGWMYGDSFIASISNNLRVLTM